MALARTIFPRLATILQNQVTACHQRTVVWTPHVNLSAGTWLQTRCLSARAKQGRDKGSKKGSHVMLSAEQLEGVANMDSIEKEMSHVIDELKLQYINRLSLRTTTGVFNDIPVSTDDGKFPLIQLAQIVQKSPKLIIINLTAAPQYIAAVKKAIADSGLNVNPQQDGTTLFVPLPTVTREYRESLSKSAKQLSDKAKVKLRDIFSKHAKKVRNKTSGPSKDLLKSAEQMILQKVHKHSDDAETLLKAKQADLLSNK